MESKSSGRGELPKPGCDGAITSVYWASSRINGRSAEYGVGPWRRRMGLPRPTWRIPRRSGVSKRWFLDRLQFLQLRQHFGGRQVEAAQRFGVGHEPLALHHDQLAESADAAAKFLDLSHHRIGCTGKQLALGNQ